MNLDLIYFVSISSSLALITLVNAISFSLPLAKRLPPFFLRHFVYRYVVRRRRLVGPWSIATTLLQLAYVVVNGFCVVFEASSLREVGMRAGAISMVNLIPLLSGPHLGALADVVGLSLHTWKLLHRSACFMAVSQAIFHSVVSIITHPSIDWSAHRSLFGVLVSCELFSHIWQQLKYTREFRHL